MAKTATDIPISQGSGVNLSNFALASGRRRQTVILADADDAGEALVAELPAHDAPDRGSPLKVGGRASANAFPAVAEGDRVDAWFGLQGLQGTISCRETATVYDQGRRVVGSQVFALTNAGAQVIPAAAGLACKVLSVQLVCSNWSTVGTAWLSNGSGGLQVMSLARVTGVGTYAYPATGYVLGYTAANTPLWWNFDGGAANFGLSLTWYMGPP